jgi:tetratricopeptide (TPR) repeat protein
VALSQEIELNKDDFSNKDDYKVAKDELKMAEELYILGMGGYSRALEHYLAVYKLNDKMPALNYKIGNCYLYSIQKSKCIEFYKKAYSQNPNVAENILYVLGKGYQLNYEFDQAMEYYK